jgi:Na+-transporting NADH:ubiquinone oxidoreductase subunit A
MPYALAKTIKLTKGFDIKLEGEALRFTKKNEISRNFAIKPLDFKGITPKLIVEQGSEVKAGDPLFYAKENEQIVFTSPVSGEVIEIKRGEKRVIQEIVILSDAQSSYKDFGTADPKQLTKEEVRSKMLSSGVWPLLRQRPFNKIADTNHPPRSIFISGFDSAPLGVDYNYILDGQSKDFQAGIDALSKLTEGKVYLNLSKRLNNSDTLEHAHGVVKTYFDGPHPSGNVGVQIHHLDPVVTKNDIVWFINPQDVLIVGRLFNTGKYDARKLVALAGSEVINKQYYEMLIGSSVSSLLDHNLQAGNQRVISGNVLSGNKISADSYLGYYDSLVTVIPEGDDEEFLGWLLPSYPRPSLSMTMPSFIFPEKKYKVNTNMHGEQRNFVMTGQYDRVFPFDIYPVQLLKAMWASDIDKMEQLGVYEIVEEDFALCEVICTSKQSLQELVREALDTVYTEMN